jgi:hypothetical protein
VRWSFNPLRVVSFNREYDVFLPELVEATTMTYRWKHHVVRQGILISSYETNMDRTFLSLVKLSKPGKKTKMSLLKEVIYVKM